MSKFMRLIVFFDLPVGTKEERREATRFRNDLIKNGYYMVQFSVYARLSVPKPKPIAGSS